MGPGRPARRHREPLSGASPEHPWAFAPPERQLARVSHLASHTVCPCLIISDAAKLVGKCAVRQPCVLLAHSTLSWGS